MLLGVVFLVVPFFGGCGGSGGGGGADDAAAAGERGIGDAEGSGGSDALIAAIAARLSADPYGNGNAEGSGSGNGDVDEDRGRTGGGSLPVWPADLDFHPAAGGESLEMLALLEDDAGRVWSLTRRFDRVAVRHTAGQGAPSGDDFAFSDVVRFASSTRRIDAGVTRGPEVDRASPGAHRPAVVAVRREAVERVTLGLASVEPRRVTVRDASLSLEQASPSRSACALDHVLREGDGLALRLRQTACPTGTVAGSLSLTGSPTLTVVGTLMDGENARPVEGRGWIRRAWGTLPTPGGAVVFDRLLLTLEDVGLVEAERSKRRSGRGPRTTSGRLRTEGAERAIELEAIDWRDADAARSARRSMAIPARWRVVVPSSGIDVVLEPLFVTDTDARDDSTPGAHDDGRLESGPLGRRWLGAVRASGTHAGVGFVEFTPTEGASE